MGTAWLSVAVAYRSRANREGAGNARAACKVNWPVLPQPAPVEVVLAPEIVSSMIVLLTEEERKVPEIS